MSSSSFSPSVRWFQDARFDLGFLHIPIWLTWLIALFLVPEALLQAKLPLWGWVLAVLALDVGHVWATIFRTYLDPQSRKRNFDILIGLPILAFLLAFLLAVRSEDLFWRVLAYVAAYHFIKQQYGFTALHQARLYGVILPSLPPDHRKDCKADLDRLRTWDKIAIYCATGFPVLVWHARLPTRISWFQQGDFLTSVRDLFLWLELKGPWGISLWNVLAAATVTLWGLSIIFWLAHHFAFCNRWKQPFPLGKALWVYGTYINWYLGIVFFDSVFVFTLTNVVAHGIPYYGLVYFYAENKWRDTLRQTSRLLAHRAVLIAAFVLPLVFFALSEEYLWDLFVHNHRHRAFFGAFLPYPLPSVTHTVWKAFWIALLSVPQIAHYLIDGFIWKADSRNPDLKQALRL